MNMDEWEHVDLWHKRGPYFLVEVKHFKTRDNLAEVRHFKTRDNLVEVKHFKTRDNCWWVYAYIYHGHPCFTRVNEVPLHGGPTMQRRYYDDRGVCVSVQVGGDYMHLGDDRYMGADDASAAAGVFLDAEKLFTWLSDCPLTPGDPSHD